MDDCDSSSSELARAIGVIDGRGANRMVFRVDRFGRGGNGYPFYKAGIPAVPMFEKKWGALPCGSHGDGCKPPWKLLPLKRALR